MAFQNPNQREKDPIINRKKFGEKRELDGKFFFYYMRNKRKDGTVYVGEKWGTAEEIEAYKKRNREYYHKKGIKEKVQKRVQKYYSENQGPIKKLRSLYRKRHKAKIKESSKRYRNEPANKEKIRKTKLNWQRRNPEKIKQYTKKYLNQPLTKKRRAEYIRTRRKTNPQENLAGSIRKRIWGALKVKSIKKSHSTSELLGCSFAFLRDHLESQFKEGMSWENRSSFHIDHIRPLASFDLTDPEQLKTACHWTNLQPLYPNENLKKSKKFEQTSTLCV
jgi:hypothetical protein